MCYSQERFEKKMLDSVSIRIADITGSEYKDQGYRTRIFDSILIIFINESNDFYKVNLHTQKVEKSSLRKDSKKDSYYAYDYYLSEACISTINYSGSEIRQYDWDGDLRKIIKTKSLFSKYHIKPFSNIVYDSVKDLFYMPIATKFREEFILKKTKKAKEYYSREGLIGAFNSKGKLIEKIGEYDELYQSDFYTHSDRYYFDLSANNEIILSQQLSHTIQIISTHKKRIALKGKFIDLDIQDIPVSKSVQKEDTKENRINSFNYGKISSANNGGLTFRYYKISATDTTTSILDTTTFEDKDLAICKAPTQRELNQEKILKSKKHYVQLFDLNTESVFYDGVFPFEGEYIYSNRYTEAGEIWTGSLTLDEIKLYRYSVVK